MLGIYVHVPFCGARCAYCDFAIVVGQDARMPAWAGAVAREIDAFTGRHGRRPADTIHFGGGTPSRLDRETLGGVLRALQDTFAVAPGAEVALEANPEDVSAASAADWAALGVNRVTVGVQALDPAGLPALGRPGRVEDGPAALAALRRAGIPSIGVDLILGRPGQTPASWRRELDALPALPVHHVSLYALETDARTPLVRAIERGASPATDPDAAAEMYEDAVAALARAGFARYEISNFALAGHASRHNLKYWTDAPYAGFGPAAASYVDGARWTNPRRLSDYLAVGRPWPEVEPYDPDRRAGEAMVCGLRRAAGIDLDALAARHGAEAVARRRPRLERAVAEGLAERDGGRIRLAGHAFFVADELFVDLL